MKKLNKKVYITIFSILTCFILSFVAVFNINDYLAKKHQIQNNLNMNKNDDNIPPEKPEDDKAPENIKFMDTTIYTVMLENGNIKGIINHSNNNLSNEDITKIAQNILKNKNIKNIFIGNLYFNKYSYKYNTNSLIIIDNTNVERELRSSLFASLFIFLVAELIIIWVTKLITNWITKPAKESFERQKEFIADASHELKTPLSVIMASAEALSENPKEEKWLNNIKLESERMNDLIIELLDLAKSEEKNSVVYKVENLSKIIELSVLTFEGIAYENKIKIDYKIKPDIKLNLNENSIKNLVEILLDNAIKHSKENSIITIVLDENIKNIELLVINEGEEIPHGEEEKIFERFYRSDKSRNRSKSRYGLGLAIAKNIVVNHNGVISAKSANNKTIIKVLFKK